MSARDDILGSIRRSLGVSERKRSGGRWWSIGWSAAREA